MEKLGLKLGKALVHSLHKAALLTILQQSSNTEYTVYSRDSGSILLDLMSF